MFLGFRIKVKQHNTNTWRIMVCVLVLIETLILFVSAIYSLWIIAIFAVLLIVACVFITVENSIVYVFLLVLPLLPILPSTAHIVVLWSMFLLMFGYWYLKWVSGRFVHERFPRYIKHFFLIFLVISTLSTFNSITPRNSIIELARYYSLFIILFVLFELVRTKRQLQFLVNIALISTALMVMLSVPDIISIGMPDFFSGGFVGRRFGSFYENANNFAIPFLFSIPALFCTIIHLQREKKNRAIKKIGLTVMFLVFLYVVLITFSRSALLSILISINVLLLTLKTGRRILLGIVALFIIILPRIYDFLFFALRLERTFTGRENLWKAAIQIVNDNILLGVGPGRFEFVKAAYILTTNYLSRLTRSAELSGAAHNLYLTVAAELGVFAALVLIIFLFMLLWRAVKLIRKTEDHDLRQLLYIALSVLSGLMIRAFFESGVIIGSGRLGDGIFFLLPVLIIARVDKIVAGHRIKRVYETG